MSETRTYAEHIGTVVETVELAGVKVDIIAHHTVTQKNIDGPVIADERDADYEAARHGEYEILAPEITFRTESNTWGGNAGDWSSSRGSRIEPRTASLGVSGTVAGAKAAARRAIEDQALMTAYSARAAQVCATYDGDTFAQLDGEAEIHPGDVVVGWGHGRYRRAVATKVTARKVHYLFTTPTGGPGAVSRGNGNKGDQVRLVSRGAKA